MGRGVDPFADNAGRFLARRRRHIGKIGPGEEAQRRIGLKPGYQPAYRPDAWEQAPMAIELDGIDPPRRRISCVLPIQQRQGDVVTRSEEHTSELQSLMRISYAVFCLKKKK